MAVAKKPQNQKHERCFREQHSNTEMLHQNVLEMFSDRREAVIIIMVHFRFSSEDILFIFLISSAAFLYSKLYKRSDTVAESNTREIKHPRMTAAAEGFAHVWRVSVAPVPAAAQDHAGHEACDGPIKASPPPLKISLKTG